MQSHELLNRFVCYSTRKHRNKTLIPYRPLQVLMQSTAMYDCCNYQTRDHGEKVFLRKSVVCSGCDSQGGGGHRHHRRLLFGTNHVAKEEPGGEGIASDCCGRSQPGGRRRRCSVTKPRISIELSRPCITFSLCCNSI